MLDKDCSNHGIKGDGKKPPRLMPTVSPHWRMEMSIQDPKRQIHYLQQCLSTDKKPLGLFLGAGCPMAIRVGTDGKSPLIPDIAGITKIVRDDLAKCNDCGPLLKIVEEHFKKDERTDTTVEDMLTHIRALRAVGRLRDITLNLMFLIRCYVLSPG